jgi:hypothetical protein
MGREITMHPLEQEIHNIEAAYRAGELNLDERNYLLQEIRDVRAAQDCADNEELFRYIVQACNLVAATV